MYPTYRKYKNIDVWFEILSSTHFIEYKKMGTKLLKEEIIATIFPEKLFIQDMLSCHEGRWEETEKIELQAFIQSN